MTTKEFEYIKENWDNCIKGKWTYGLEPFELALFETLKPEGDYFIAFPSSEYYQSKDKDEFFRKLKEDDNSVTKVRIHHKKVQKITGYSKGRYLANWENKDWKVEVRNDKLRQLGI